MKRRDFIHHGMLGAAVLGAAGCSSMRFRKITLKGKMADFSFDVTHPKPSGTMPTGEIGRTGIKVSKFGFGAHMPQGLVPFEKERRIMIREAYDLGVTLYDVYDDGNWKVYQYEPMGKHLAPMIKDVVISIVMSPYDDRTFEQEFERTLRVFGRDYIDLVRLYSPSHDAGNWDQWEKLLKLKEQGYIRAVGVPIHFEKDIEVVLREIPIDFVLLPYNFYHNILWDGKLPGDFNPLAKKLREKGIGVITMKPFGTDWFVTPLIQAARQLDKTNSISLPLAALRYVINSGLNADATIGGMYNLDHVYENVMAYYKPELLDDERNLLDKVIKVACVASAGWMPGHYAFLEKWAPKSLCNLKNEKT